MQPRGAAGTRHAAMAASALFQSRKSESMTMNTKRPRLELADQGSRKLVAIVYGGRRIPTTVQAEPEVVAAFNDGDADYWRGNLAGQHVHIELMHEVTGEHWTGTAQERAAMLDTLRELAGVPDRAPQPRHPHVSSDM